MSKVIDKKVEQEKRMRNFSDNANNFLISKIEKNKYVVLSLAKVKTYHVDLNDNTCDCPDYIYRCKDYGIDCKHLVAVKDLEAEKKARVLKAIARW